MRLNEIRRKTLHAAILALTSTSLIGCISSSGSSGGLIDNTNEAYSGFGVGLDADVEVDQEIVAHNTSVQTSEGDMHIVKYANGAYASYRSKEEQVNFSGDDCDDATAACDKAVYPYKDRLVHGGGGEYEYMRYASWNRKYYEDRLLKRERWISGISGQRTATMPNTGTATYTGYFGMAVTKAGDETSASIPLDGSMTLTADFGRETFSAEMQADGYAPGRGSSSVRINANGNLQGSYFETTNVNGSFRAGSEESSITQGKVRGAFFGPNAEEVGATVTMGTSDGFKGAGFLAGKKQ